MMKTPPEAPEPRTQDRGKEETVIVGVMPPPGLRWRIVGKWPDGRTEDILREMGEDMGDDD